MNADHKLTVLTDYLSRVPGIKKGIGSGQFEDGNWWVKFGLDIKHPLSWNVVQEIGFVTNYLSLNERLPTVFYPVSPPPYLNGGPEDFLSWVIESKDTDFSPQDLTEWFEARLPNPVEDIEQWSWDDDEEEDGE